MYKQWLRGHVPTYYTPFWMARAGGTMTSNMDRSKSGKGSLLGLGGGPWEGHTVNIADPVPFKP